MDRDNGETKVFGMSRENGDASKSISAKDSQVRRTVVE